MNARTMAYRSLSFVGSALTLFSLYGCAANEEANRRLSSDIGDLRSIQAEQTAAISEIRAELGRLTGKMDELQYNSQGKTQALEQALEQVSSRVPPPPGVPGDLLSADEDAISSISGVAADQFRTGLQQIRSGDFGGAEATFTSFVDANSNTAFTDNALFWLGVATEKRNEPDRAIGYYNDAARRFPAEDRAAPALLRLAQVLRKLGSKDDASLTLRKLLSDYPRSPVAAEARELLSQLTPPPPVKKGSSRR